LRSLNEVLPVKARQPKGRIAWKGKMEGRREKVSVRPWHGRSKTILCMRPCTGSVQLHPSAGQTSKQAGRQAGRRSGVQPVGGSRLGSSPVAASSCPKVKPTMSTGSNACLRSVSHADMQTVNRAVRSTPTIAGRPKGRSRAAPQQYGCENPSAVESHPEVSLL
jgi:hypothetical protein